MENIGKSIRKYRVKEKMTQDELAEKLYVTRQTVSNYETGRSKPDVETLMRISELFGVGVEELIYDGKPKEPVNWRRIVALAIACAGLFGLILYLMPIAKSLRQQEFFVDLYALLWAGLYPLLFMLLGWLTMLLVQATLKLRVPDFRGKRWALYAMTAVLGIYAVNLLPMLLGNLVRSVKLALGEDISGIVSVKIGWQYLTSSTTLMLVQSFIMKYPVLFYFYSLLMWLFKPAAQKHRTAES